MTNIAWVVMYPTDTYALPAGGVVAAGNAVIESSVPNTVQINQTSPKAIVNWQSYNVAQHEQVNYHQPSSSSITLNRINPNSGVSQIYGSINANGQVWLINPAGIWFGPNSHVNVGGLVATTADISNADFMAGHYNFVQSTGWNGAVINEGYITVMNHGLAALVGPGAVNKGQITANFGTVVLGAGQRFTIDFAGDSLVNFTISGEVTKFATDQDGHPLKHVVENSGTITAHGGKIQMTANAAAGVLDEAINMKGFAVANSVSVKNGEIILSAGDGRVTVTGTVQTAGNKRNETGGTIKILGNEVVLAGHAVVDASGKAGGGTILIGGNAYGAGPEQNAAYAFLGRDVNIYADARELGKGGKVVLWSDIGTHFYGNIFARGGIDGGDGGWVETSGKAFLNANGSVTASAPRGKNGSWLLDPYNVAIVGATANGAFDGGSPNTFTPTADTATVNAATINASLDAGTSVVITTGAGGAQAGTITVSSAITKSSGATTPQLTLNAAGAIAINAAIGFTSGGLDLVLISGGAITQTAALTVSSLLANAGANAITLTNAGNDFSGAVSLNNTGANAVAIRDANALQFGTSTIGGALTVTAAGAVTQSGAVTVTGVTTVAAGVGNNVTLNNASNDFSTFGVTTGLDVTVNDANALILGTTTASGLLNVTTNGAITQSGTVIATGVATFDAGAANNITLATATNNFSTLSVTSANNVSLRDANAIILGASTIGGTLGVTTAGAITQSGALSVTGATTLAAGAANSITLNDAGNDFSSLGVTTGLNVAVTDANALALAVSTISGTLGVTTNGAITQTGALTITGVTTLAAGAANDITLATLTNNFSTVSITSGNNVTLRDSGAIILGTSTAATSLGVIAGGAITQSGVLTSPTLTAKTLGTSLAITLNTSINEVDALDLRSRNAGDTADSGGAIAYRDATGFNIANMIATTSTVTLTAGDAITQNSGVGTGIFGTTLTVKTLNNTGAAITLANALNALTTIDLRARNAGDAANVAGAIAYRDANGVAVAAANTTSTVTLTTGGAITQTGAMTGTTLTAKTLLDIGAAITLNIAAGNIFTTINLLARNAADTVNAAGAIAYRSASGFDVTGIATTSTLSLQNNNTPTNSPMTQSGAIVAGVTTLIGGATNDITFNDVGNDFGTVATTSGLNVALTDANALILGTSTVSGTLGVATSGAITQSGALTVTGVTTLAAGSGNNITLNSANNFSTLGITSGNNVAFTDSGGIILGTSTVSGTLGVTANGAITQSGALSVSGVTTLAAGAANSITLNNVSNDFSTVGVTTGANVALTDVNSLILGASTVSGTYGVTTSGAITQSGALTITGVATLAAGAVNDITLNSANNFSTIGFTNGNNVAFTDSNAVILGASTISGTLGVTAAGAVTQSGALAVSGNATIAAGAANSITLNTAGNNFNSVGITSALNVALTDSNALNLAASTIAGTLGVTTSGAITQSGALAVTGVTTLAAGAANSITLNDSANNFSTVAITTGLNVGLSDANALILAASTVSGTLDVNTSGAITQSGALTVTGVATLGAGAANNITLNAANNFSTIGITSGNNVLLTDANALNFAASTLSGTLGVSASGAITQSGALSVAGVTTLSVGVGNNITLNNASNDFSTVSISTGLNVGLTDANSLILGTSNVSGTYGVTTSGAITQSGALIVTGVTTLAAGAANDITLTTATNNFSTVSTTSGNNVALRDSGTLIIGATTVANSLTVTAGSTITQSGVIEAPNLTVKTMLNFGAGIILNTSLNKVDNIDLRARNSADTANAAGAISYQDENGFNVANSLATISTISLIAGGDVTQNTGVGTGIFGTTLTVLTKNNSGAAVTLTNSLNNVTTIDLRSRNAANSANAAGALAYTDLNAVAVAAANTTSTVSLIAGNAITQSGTMTGTILIAKTLLDAGAAIALNIAAGNEFNTINLLARNTADTANAAGAISYRDATGFDVAGIATTSTLSLQNNNTPTNSPITQSGAIVAGVTTLIGGATNDITLNNAGNDFGTVATTSGLNVALTDANALILGASTVSGTLGVNTTGAITQSGVLNVTGVTTLAAGAANNITLNSANNFSTIGITSGNNVGITDANALILAASTVGGTLGVTTNGAITQSGALSVAGVTTLAAGAANNITLNNTSNDFATVGITTALNVGLTDANSLILGTSTVSGTYGVTTSGAITQSGALTITGVATLAAGSANNITLNSANNFSTIVFTNGNNVAFTDSSGVILGASTVSGTLGVTANGAITQSGALSVAGATTLAAGAANSITLTNVSNNFSIVGVTTGLNVSLTDANSLDLAASTISGTLGITTSGAITQSGALSVTGVTTLAAGATNNITLNALTNNFSTVGITSGNNVGITDANALILAASTVSGTLDVNTSGAITQSGVLTVTGVTTLAAGAVNNITLNSANNFSTIGVTSGNNVGITDANALILGASTVSGSLGVTATGAITQSGALSVAGVTTLAAGAANSITLNDAGNDFSTVGITSGLNVSLTDTNALILGASTVSGTYGVTTSGAITQSGVLAVTGAATLAAGAANNITLNSANNFNTIGFTSGNDVAFTDLNSVILDASTISGNFGVTTAGAITQSAGLVVAGAATLSAGVTNNITLDHSLNNFNELGIVSGLNVSIKDINALSLAVSTVSGAMTVVTGGALSQSGALIVNGVGGLSVTSVGGALLTNSGNQIAVFNGSNSSSGNIELTTALPLTIASLSQAGGGSVVLVGSGSIQVPNGVTINTGNGALSITASDLNLNSTGALNSGTADSTITANAGTVGVGLAVGSMSISNSELQRITAANLIINGLDNVTLQVDGVALADTSTINGAVTFGSHALNSTVTFANNASLFKSLNVIAESNVFVNVLIGTTVGDLTVTGPLQLNIPSVTTAGAQIYNGAVQLGSNVNLNAGGNIIFGGTLDSLGSMRNVTLNAGASGDINFVGPVGSVMRLGDLTIANVNNTSNTALMKVNSFIQSAGGTTTLGAFGLDALGVATVMASSITGKVTVQGLTLNTQTAYLNGTVAGLSGQQAINQIILLNTILPGTHFFDGIDMFISTPPNPVVPVIAPSPAQIFASYLSSSANVISPIQGLSKDIFEYNAVSSQAVVQGCVVVTPSIKVCRFPSAPI